MAGLRKAAAYSKRSVVPYTRSSKKKGKSYIKMVPVQKIVKFTMGSENLFEKGKFPYHLIVVSKENVQIRHNALESCRQHINKSLEKNFLGQYVFKVVPFPHHIQRENKMLTGAGADRMQTGMQLSFGKATEKAAIVKEGNKIFFFAFSNERAMPLARKLIDQVRAKLPCQVKVLYEDARKSQAPKPIGSVSS